MEPEPTVQQDPFAQYISGGSIAFGQRRDGVVVLLTFEAFAQRHDAADPPSIACVICGRAAARIMRVSVVDASDVVGPNRAVLPKSGAPVTTNTMCTDCAEGCIAVGQVMQQAAPADLLRSVPNVHLE